MRKHDAKLIFSPSDLNVFFESPFASWMDRYKLERPGELTPDPRAAEMALLADMGNAHEREHLAHLQSTRAVWEPPSDLRTFEEKHAATLAGMREGHEVIYQAALAHGEFQGLADFLYRVDVPSKLGAWSYEVGDAKLARKVKPYFLLQLCAYAKMLASVQGDRPSHVRIVGGAGTETTFRTDDYFFYFTSLEREFLALHRAFDPAARPLPSPRADHGRWQSHADAILEEMDHPCRVAGITSHQMKRLADAGVATMTQLAELDTDRIPKMDSAMVVRLRRQAHLQRASAGLAAPLYELIAPDSTNARLGLASLPPVSPMDVYFDMEGYPLVAGGLEYLFGATHVESGQPAFTDFWAHDRAGEKRAFEAFVDWTYARFLADRTMHVFHYAAYEVSALRRLMGAHATREAEVDALLKAEVFVDLYRVVKQAVRVGEPSYSLKKVEHLYRPARAGEVATAGESVVEYARWLENQDGKTWESSAILDGIRKYNREDCESTWQLREWLAARQAEATIAYVPPTKRKAKKEEDAEKEAARRADQVLAARVLDSIPADRSADPERWRIHELLGHLVGFHRREDKPSHWAMFDRKEKTDEELAEDGDCLGGLTRTETRRTKEKLSFAYEYRFDPDQDTKLHEESDCFIAETLVKTSIVHMDREKGLLTIKLGPKVPEPPASLSLIPSEVVDAKGIVASIGRVAEQWLRDGALPGPLDTLLRRTPPRVRGVAPGAPLLTRADTNADGITRVIANMDGTTIAIQGPPGAGKTRVASAAIASLALAGHRVGISSNSHKAIQKLIQEVQARVAAAGKAPLRITKIKRDMDDELITAGLVTGAASMNDVDFTAKGAPQIVAGTAWAFSEASAVGQFTHLFVDEAGQVSLANLVGMSPCAKNLVLLGDQMQLGQPIQGSHPGESGKSALEYLMQDHRTIPDHLGLFLGTTWRLHPDLCRFISGAVYEDRLLPESHTVTRTIRAGATSTNVALKEAGILFIPVAHEGNAQASDEEVDAIRAILAELRTRELTGTAGERAKLPNAFNDKDVLLVSPYNMQVRKLRAAIPNVLAGSVDRFQGQEAAVVIVSMCASSGESSSRGLEFLFNPNRLNVAISRAQSLAVVVGSPELARTRVSTVAQMKLVNLFCRVIEEGSAP
jgi:predicted RecB family nuclease